MYIYIWYDILSVLKFKYIMYFLDYLINKYVKWNWIWIIKFVNIWCWMFSNIYDVFKIVIYLYVILIFICIYKKYCC